MVRRLPSLTALRAFDAAARKLHFSRAAEELAVTPGAISRQIQALESALGIQLFRRSGRTVALTERGRAFADEVADAFDRLALAADKVRDSGRSRPLSICAYPTFAMRWLMPRWRKFNDLHPGIDLQLTTSLAAVDAVADGYDAVIRIGDGRLPGHSAIALAPVDVFPVCAPRLRRKLRAPADLRDHVLIHSGSRPHDWPRWLHEAGIEGEIDAKHGPRFESLGLAYQAAIEGVGVAMGVGCLVADDLAAGRLARPLSFSYRSKWTFNLFYPSARATEPRLAALCSFLMSESEVAMLQGSADLTRGRKGPSTRRG